MNLILLLIAMILIITMHTADSLILQIFVQDINNNLTTENISNSINEGDSNEREREGEVPDDAF